MSDHFVDAAYQKVHKHDLLGGTPHLEDEDDYRREHMGRNVNLSDRQFPPTVPIDMDPDDIQTRPSS